MTTKFAQVLIGPAGSGKSTYISTCVKYFNTIQRNVHCVNLDPAAGILPYTPDIDVRNVINYSNIMKNLEYGPNGALIFCMEQITSRQSNWFHDAIGDHEYDYLLIDFPGQIELFSHLDILSDLMNVLIQKDYHVIILYLMDAQFMTEPAKFLSGSLVALSTMTMLEVPHLNIISKCDLISEEHKRDLDIYTEMDYEILADEIKDPSENLKKLTRAICDVFDMFRIVQWHTFDSSKDDEIIELQAEIDSIIQYYDNADYGDAEFHEVGDAFDIPKDIPQWMYP